MNHATPSRSPELRAIFNRPLPLILRCGFGSIFTALVTVLLAAYLVKMDSRTKHPGVLQPLGDPKITSEGHFLEAYLFADPVFLNEFSHYHEKQDNQALYAECEFEKGLQVRWRLIQLEKTSSPPHFLKVALQMEDDNLFPQQSFSQPIPCQVEIGPDQERLLSVFWKSLRGGADIN